MVRPSAFEADLSKGVLRSKEEMLELLRKLGQVAGVWRKQYEDATAEYARTHPAHPTSPDQEQEQEQLQQQENIKKDVTKPTKAGLDADAKDVLERANAAKQITSDVAKAQELYDIDELSRLRQPGMLESLLLKIPSLLSHAPAAYQRDFVRGRFYFRSFPGPLFESRVVVWLEQAQKDQQEREVKEVMNQAEDSGHVSGDDENINGGHGGVPTGQLVDI